MKPEVELIAIKRSDGGLSIMHFVTKGMLNDVEIFVRPATDEAIEEEIAKAALPSAAISWRRVSEAELPERFFRDAWVDIGDGVAVDMPKAREIHRARLREMRTPLIEALDIEYQRADERGDMTAKTEIADKKQALRDVTADPAIEAAKTPDDLKAVLPAALR